MDYYEISENKWLDEADRQHAIDRILATGNENEVEKFKVNVKLDPLTGEFVRQEHVFDENAFKEEGKDYFAEREKAEIEAKEKQAKQDRNWDQRILRSEKMRDLCVELISDNQKVPPKKEGQKEAKGVTKVIVG